MGMVELVPYPWKCLFHTQSNGCLVIAYNSYYWNAAVINLLLDDGYD